MSYISKTWECVAELVSHSSWIYGVPITPEALWGVYQKAKCNNLAMPTILKQTSY